MVVLFISFKHFVGPSLHFSIQVSFSNDFLKSISSVKDAETCKEVLTLLENLANGWRQSLRKKNLYVHQGTSSQLLEQYKVKGLLHLVWTVDVLEENSYYIQILKFWDILPLAEIPKLANHLDVLFENYTVKKMNRCKYKCLDGYALYLNSFLLLFNFLLVNIASKKVKC